MCLAGGVVSESATADFAANGPPGAISIAGRLMSRRLTTSLTGSRRPEILAGVVRKRCGLTCAQVVERDGGKLRVAAEGEADQDERAPVTAPDVLAARHIHGPQRATARRLNSERDTRTRRHNFRGKSAGGIEGRERHAGGLCAGKHTHPPRAVQLGG